MINKSEESMMFEECSSTNANTQMTFVHKTLKTKNIQRLKDEIIKNFDFENVYKVMQVLDWTWLGEPAPPSIARLKEEANRLLDWVLQDAADPLRASDTYFEVSTGGFTAFVYRYPDKNLLVRLAFYAENWEVHASHKGKVREY
jgi:hypothetical protein